MVPVRKEMDIQVWRDGQMMAERADEAAARSEPRTGFGDRHLHLRIRSNDFRQIAGAAGRAMSDDEDGRGQIGWQPPHQADNGLDAARRRPDSNDFRDLSLNLDHPNGVLLMLTYNEWTSSSVGPYRDNRSAIANTQMTATTA